MKIRFFHEGNEQCRYSELSNLLHIMFNMNENVNEEKNSVSILECLHSLHVNTDIKALRWNQNLQFVRIMDNTRFFLASRFP